MSVSVTVARTRRAGSLSVHTTEQVTVPSDPTESAKKVVPLETSTKGHKGHKDKVKTWHPRLYTFDELPSWQQNNDKIVTGYVRETNSLSKCLLSLLYFHNETINIFTHLIPSLFYLTRTLSAIYTGKYLSAIFTIGATICFLNSSTFHCLKQHSHRYETTCGKLDYLGIILLITTSMLPMIYIGYFDHFYYHITFNSLTVTLATVYILVVCHPKFDDSKHRKLRAACFTAFGLLGGLVPLITGLVKFGVRGVKERIKLNAILCEAVCYILGAVLYGYRVPERFVSKGSETPWRWVDMVGSSHQLFHCLVVCGTMWHFNALEGSYALMDNRRRRKGLNEVSFVAAFN